MNCAHRNWKQKTNSYCSYCEVADQYKTIHRLRLFAKELEARNKDLIPTKYVVEQIEKITEPRWIYEKDVKC